MAKLLKMPTEIFLGVRNTMFLSGQYDLAWSPKANKWLLEHPSVGIIKEFRSLINGLSELERVSGRDSSTFITRAGPYG